MHRSRFSVPFIGRLGLLPLGLLLWLGLTAKPAVAQPANDNFANAQVLVGASGSVAGSNVGATDESAQGELVLGIGSTVWYKWTAVADGPVTFQTEGSSFDTLLTVSSGSSLNNLTLITFNDDINYPADVASRVTFTAINGTTYYFQVDGAVFGLGSEGSILLSWTPQAIIAAGDFQFTSSSYLYTERESASAANGFMDGGIPAYRPTVGGDVSGVSYPSAGPRLTVSRFGGSVGRVYVNYSVTNAMYTNMVEAFVSAENVLTTNLSTGTFTNSYTTNSELLTFLQDDEYGNFVYLPFANFTLTNSTIIVSGNLTNVIIGATNGTTTNFSFACIAGTTNGVVTNGNNEAVSFYTNDYCFFTNYTVLVPAAIPRRDYVPLNGTLVFDDYQMSADILPTVFEKAAGGLLATNTPIPNRALIATITSVSLDPTEAPEIQPPTALSPNSLVTISDLKTLPSLGLAFCDAMNFERATLQCTRNVNGQLIAHVGVLRNNCSGNGIDVPYRIDFLAPSRPNELNTFPLQAGSDYATPSPIGGGIYGTDPDFASVTGTVHWDQNDCTAIHFIDIPITNYNKVEFNEDLLVQLYYPPGYTITPCQNWYLGYQNTCTLTILYDNERGDAQPAGAVDRMHNMDADSTTFPPYNLLPGANSTVYALAVHPNGGTIIGGDFTAFDTVTRNRIARMLPNGQLDTSFDPGDGADKFVTSVVLDPSLNVYVAGAFSSINHTPRNRIARLRDTGALDTSFFPGLGANGTIWQLAVQNGTNVVIAGEFTTFNGTNRTYIARLHNDGSLDTTFDPGIGPNGPIYAIAPQPDGKILIGGRFSKVDNIPSSCIARLNADGTYDGTFNPRSGVGGDAAIVYAFALQNDGKILLGGNFSAVYGISRNNIARVNSDGSLDFTFNPGVAADDAVYSISIQPADGEIIIAGQFKSYNETRRVGIARLFTDGTLDTSFMDTAYNQFAGIINHFYNPDVEPPNFILATAIQPADGNIMIGGNFQRVGGGWTRDDYRFRWNVARLIGGATPGPGNIRLTTDNYTADDVGGDSFITLSRDNGHLGPAGVTIQPAPLPIGTGAAVQGTDYTFNSVWANPQYLTSWSRPTWQMQDGTYGQNQGGTPDIRPGGTENYPNNDSYITVMQSATRGDKYVNLELHKPNGTDIFVLGGENIPLGVALGKSLASFEIVDSHRDHGTFNLSSSVYYSSEGTNALITVIRSAGSDGQVSVQYAATDGTATNGIHYNAVTNTLTFVQGVTNLSFVVQTRKEGLVDGDHTVNVRIFTPSGGAVLGTQTNAILNLVDDDAAGGLVEFTSPTFGTNENAGVAQVTVFRHVSSLGILKVLFSATDGTAKSGINYTATTNLLTWASGDIAPKTISIPVFQDGIVEASNYLNINLTLYSASVNGSTNAAYLGPVSSAVLTLTNNDLGGQVAFSRPAYTVNENGGFAIIPIVRTGGSAGSLRIHFAATDATAYDGIDYVATSGDLVLSPGQISTNFMVRVIDNNYTDPARFIALTLSNPSLPDGLGNPSTATLNIIDDESLNASAGGYDGTLDPSLGFNGDVHSLALQPDGSLLVGGDFLQANGINRNRLARMNPDGSVDLAFSSISASAGANDTVLAIAPQTDQRILVGGNFTAIDGVARNYLARLTYNGFVDSTFNPGAGPNGPINAVVETFSGTDRKLLVGGAFTYYGGVPQNNLVRLNDDGTSDLTYGLNLGGITGGLDGSVYAIALQPDGKAIVGGDFIHANGLNYNHVIRLNADGSVDTTFNPGSGPNGSVRAVAVQLDGRILIAGIFTNVDGIGLNHVARLLSDGTLDTQFSPGTGLNDLVTSIALQSDTRIVLGGQFTTDNGVTRRRLTRLNADGSVDTMINFGSGADAYVAATLVQPDGNIVFGGGFTNYDGQIHQHLARIYGGTIAGSGSLAFDSAVYMVDETGTNALVTVRRNGGTSSPAGATNITVHFATSNGTAIAPTNYSTVVTNLSFPPGEVFESVAVPIFRDFLITPDLSVNVTLSNPLPASADGPTLGDQASAIIDILNDDSDVSFGAPGTYSVVENSFTGSALIPVIRTGSTRLPASVNYFTTTNGTAIAFTNYIPVTNATIPFAIGQATNYAQVPLVYDPSRQGTRTVQLQLTNPVSALLVNPVQATLNILDVDKGAGQFYFSQTNYIVSEGAGLTAYTILRTNGVNGVVTINYSTLPGTATAGLKYVSTNGSITFNDGEVSKTMYVQIIDENLVQGDLNFFLSLSLDPASAAAGATFLGSSTVPVTILDNDIGVGFTSPIYIATETDGSVTLGLNRVGTNVVTQVSYETADGTALAGTNYSAQTGILKFAVGENFKTFQIPVLHDPHVTGALAFTVNLFFSPADILVNAGTQPQIFANNPTTVDVLDADPGISFTNANFYTIKSGTNVLITVVRTNANTGTVSVNYATTNVTAVAGTDYGQANGQLVFSNGVSVQTFTIPIINNHLVEGDRTFRIDLLNASPGVQLLPPSSAFVTITDDVAGLSFSQPVYNVREDGVFASIKVFRSGYTNDTVSVDYATADGTAKAGVNYLGKSGTLTFTNGQTEQSFPITLIDDSVLSGDKTVLLSLRNVTGNAVAINPSAATLNIIETDGSLIVPAGAALTSESGPVNNAIDPNERVTVLFGLRNASGDPTTNLVATLLATNGVTAPSGSQNYGALLPHGVAASRAFSFTASGTNGQSVTATFALSDGGVTFTNKVIFNFLLGSLSATYSNSAPIVINDNGPASPYPSQIVVNGLGNAVVHTAVVLTNFSHTYPRDVDVLLVSPSGANSYLMAKSGASFAVSGLTLGFDDGYSTYLPSSSMLVSGTNHPTSYAAAPPPFTTPAPPAPYSTNLAAFNGSNPNGSWSLYIIDDSPFNSGIISNGWMLSLSTAGTFTPSADLGLAMASAPIGSALLLSNVTYSIALNNYGPVGSTNIVVTDTLPTSGAYVSASAGVGSITTNSAGQVVWNVPSLAANAAATLSVTVKALSIGTMTNAAFVTSQTADPNPDDDAATVASTIVPQTAELGVALSSSPNLLLLGSGNSTYTLSAAVSNAGPATASGLNVSFTLPSGVTFVSGSPAGYIVNGNTITFPALWDLGGGAVASASIVARPTIAGTFTNIVSCSSSVTDPFKANNTASVKTVVEALRMSANSSGGNLVITWPADASNYYLESSTSLGAGAIWTRVTSPAPVTVGAQTTITIPVGSGSMYFRLRSTTP